MEQWEERYRRLAAVKTRAAMDVRLFPYRTILSEPTDSALPMANEWTRTLFDGPFYLSRVPAGQRPGCSLVFVQSADGNTAACDPADLGGGNTDKHLVYEGLSRVAADAVMSGAETVRDGDIVFSVWHPELVRLRDSFGLPRHPMQIVTTLRGVPVERMLLCNVPEIPVIVITLEEAARRMRAATAERPWVTLLTMTHRDDLPGAFAALRSRGIGRISCVGGRTLASELLRHGLVDDVYLTTGANPGGEPGTPLSNQRWRGRVIVRKAGTGPEIGVTFEHVLPATATAELHSRSG